MLHTCSRKDLLNVGCILAKAFDVAHKMMKVSNCKSEVEE